MNKELSEKTFFEKIEDMVIEFNGEYSGQGLYFHSSLK